MTFSKYIGDSKMFEYDNFYHQCQQQNQPFIKAKTNPAHGNYFIQLDLMPCNYKLSDETQIQIRELINTEIKYVKIQSKYDFVGFNITNELAWFDGVSKEHFDSFCNTLYDLIQKNHG